MTDAYTAFKETDACARCHEGESWTVKGPDGACIGQSWEGDDAECSAEEEAQALNAAFEAGKQTGADLLTALRECLETFGSFTEGTRERYAIALARTAIDNTEARWS